VEVVPLAAPFDDDPKLADYAHPQRLVTTQWLAANLETPGLVVVESNEDVLLYETGHIRGAVKVDWHTDLNDEVTRDYVDGVEFAALMAAKGISRDDTVVIYGDKSNWWAAYALWVFALFGHPDVRLLDGGRSAWIGEGREVTTEPVKRPTTSYPVVERADPPLRAFKDDVLAHLGRPMIDVRRVIAFGAVGVQQCPGHGRPRPGRASSPACARPSSRCSGPGHPPGCGCAPRHRPAARGPGGRHWLSGDGSGSRPASWGRTR